MLPLKGSMAIRVPPGDSITKLAWAMYSMRTDAGTAAGAHGSEPRPTTIAVSARNAVTRSAFANMGYERIEHREVARVTARPKRPALLAHGCANSCCTNGLLSQSGHRYPGMIIDC
jgi:hypothetical protein